MRPIFVPSNIRALESSCPCSLAPSNISAHNPLFLNEMQPPPTLCSSGICRSVRHATSRLLAPILKSRAWLFWACRLPFLDPSSARAWSPNAARCSFVPCVLRRFSHLDNVFVACSATRFSPPFVPLSSRSIRRCVARCLAPE